MIYCPVCNKSMIILEYDQVEIDYCPSCEGSWLDQGELELLLDLPAAAIDLSTASEAPRGKRRCPRCRKNMHVQDFPQTNIEVDICPGDGGIWLDKGELLAIAQIDSQNEAGKRLKHFINELFKHPS
jgi:uncharacterized protein